MILYMTSKNQMVFYNIKSELWLFYALEIFFMLQIKVNTQNNNILINKIEYKKVKYLIFKKCIINIIKYFNV